MDEGLSRAVRLVFVTLYNDGLIYRGDYIINWCPRCRTALADLEVEHEQKGGHLYYIRYPVTDGSGAYLTVATTRPETMFGDTAVAVNPKDKRYSHFKGKAVHLPLTEREIPIIFDPYVTMEFGTGALKITPAHDLNDFQIGNNHKLERVVVIDDGGVMNENAGAYAGMDRWAARERVVEDLNTAGLLEKIEDYPVPVGTCYRCHTVIEPILKKQWFVKTETLAAEAIKAVKEGKTRIVPAQWEKTYFEWMYNIRDWCVSRQIWWGHRIPAWYCDDCGEVIVAMEEPKGCAKCQGAALRQETDVLDTWFSSALWPFSTLGWPDKTKDLDVYYPTSVLVTGFDILFFWVARMMMMGLYFMKEVPFKDVYIHALVRDEQGSKMSKSKGNVIDPLTIIDKYGADAFRFTLAAFAAMGRDIKLSEGRIEGYRFFINKLWNAARFVMMNLPEGYKPDYDFAGRDFSLADRWVLSRLHAVTGEVTDSIDRYEFNNAATSVYHFAWHELCDWYLEVSKIYLSADDPAVAKRVRDVLVFCLDTLLRLLHPFIPFVTEELHTKLPGSSGSLIAGPFPVRDDALFFPGAEQQFDLIRVLVTGIRNIRGEMNIHPKKRLVVLVSAKEKDQAVVRENVEYVRTLAGVETVEMGESIARPEASATAVCGPFTVYIPLAGVIDFEEEKKRQASEIEKLNDELEKVNRKLGNDEFVKKAPGDVVAKEKERMAQLVSKKERVSESIDRLQEYFSKGGK